LKAEEEARLKAEEEERLRIEEETRRQAEEEAKLRAEEEARLKAEEEARLKAELEERLRIEEEMRIKAEEARIKAEEEAARLKAAEEERLRIEEEMRLKAEEEARLKAEEEARIKAEEEAKQRAIEAAQKKIAEEEEIAKRIAEAERRIAEQERLQEIERVERARQEEELRKIREEKRRSYEENLVKYEKIISAEAELISGTHPPAFFGGRKFEQIEKIKTFLRATISLQQFINDPCSFNVLLQGLKNEELSKDVTELFPRINIANFLTVSGWMLEKNNIETVIEVSDFSQENDHLKSVLHVDAQNADGEENFNLIADLIEQKKLTDSSVAIICEKGPQVAATLSLTHPIKYDGVKTSKAAEIVLKKKPSIQLDERIMRKLKLWEWKVRKERMIRRTVELTASQLPLMSVMALFWLGLRMLQDKVEREHRRDEKDLCDYDYFDIIRWP